jgi:cold shock CspA family protein
MYGFLKDDEDLEVFFHLGTFVPHESEEEPVPPIPGEEVDVEMGHPPMGSDKAPRAARVYRLHAPQKLTGVVEKFDNSRGYGYVIIEREGQEVRYFLHKSEVYSDKIPLTDDEVEFYEGMREGKTRACNVKILRRKIEK